MRIVAPFLPMVFTYSTFAPMCRGDGYPEASPDQATEAVKSALRIERYRGMDEEALQVEYEWALKMAELCLNQFTVDLLNLRILACVAEIPDLRS